MKVRIRAYESIPHIDLGQYQVEPRMYEVDDVRVIEHMSQYMCEPLHLVDGGDGDFVLYDSRRTQWDADRAALFRKVTDEGYRFVWAKSRIVLFAKEAL